MRRLLAPIRRKAAGQREGSMRDSKRFERGFPPLAKEGQGGFERASQNPPQSPFFKLIMSHISWLWTLQGEVPPFSKLALPTNRSAGDDPTPQALCIIALGCRVVSAATQGGGTSRWRPGVARTGQPQAMLRNTFGVVPQQTTSFSGRVQHRCLWARLGEGEAEPRTGSVQKAKMWVKISFSKGEAALAAHDYFRIGAKNPPSPGLEDQYT